MRAFILVACLAIASARPEAGYTYSSGSASNQIGSLPNANTMQAYVHQQLPQEHSFASFAIAPQMTYVPPSASSAPAETYIAPIVPAEPQADPMQQLQQQQQDSYNMAHLLSSLPHEASATSAGYAYAPMQTTVHKHIYVHVPPKDFEEEDAVQPQVRHQMGPKQKHYKIVFIKAPSAPAMRAPIVAPPPQNEEKTLIYVLHKKPEFSQDIVIPTAPPSKPSKPEVYFIKYKTKKEEAPVYGPPPPAGGGADPRHGEPLTEYGSPSAAGAQENLPMESRTDLAAPAPITTQQPAMEEPAPQQFAAIDMPAATYGTPTMAAFVANEETPQPTLSAVPSNQYLAPEPTAVVVEKQHLPASNYGPPTRFFIKKK